MQNALKPYIPVQTSDMAFSIIYRGCYWFLEYNPESEFDEGLQGSEDRPPELNPGLWILSRDPSRREPPPRYVFPAAAPFLHFADCEREYTADMARALSIIESDFEAFARERKAMHKRKLRPCLKSN